MRLIILTIVLLVGSGAFVDIVRAVNKEAYDWIGVPDDSFEEAYQESNLEGHSEEIQKLIEKLEIMGVNMTTEGLEMVYKAVGKNVGLVEAVKKYLTYAWTPIEFIEEKKKLRHLKTFCLEYPKYSEKVFDSRNSPQQRGKRLGNFLKGFFQWYYITVLSQSSTLSTVLMRSLTAHTPVLSHKDFSYCIDLQSVGQLCQQLQNMDINSVFLKVPAVFDVMRHLKLKAKCQNDENKQLLKNLTSRLQGIDMFRYVYEYYEPFVDIATEKYGITKVKMLARNLASMIDNSTMILEEQRTKPSPLSPGKAEDNKEEHKEGNHEEEKKEQTKQTKQENYNVEL